MTSTVSILAGSDAGSVAVSCVLSSKFVTCPNASYQPCLAAAQRAAAFFREVLELSFPRACRLQAKPAAAHPAARHPNSSTEAAAQSVCGAPGAPSGGDIGPFCTSPPPGCTGTSEPFGSASTAFLTCTADAAKAVPPDMLQSLRAFPHSRILEELEQQDLASPVMRAALAYFSASMRISISMRLSLTGEQLVWITNT